MGVAYPTAAFNCNGHRAVGDGGHHCQRQNRDTKGNRQFAARRRPHLHAAPIGKQDPTRPRTERLKEVSLASHVGITEGTSIIAWRHPAIKKVFEPHVQLHTVAVPLCSLESLRLSGELLEATDVGILLMWQVL